MNEVEICSVALRELRAAPIASFDDNTNEARIAKAIYEPTRDALMCEEPWRFAMKRASLVVIAVGSVPTPPIDLGDYDLQYQLPTDCLAVRCVNDREDCYTVEGDRLLANETVVNIGYTAKIEDTTKFHPHFTKALILRLASLFAYPITGSKELTKTFDDLTEKQIAKARYTDAIMAPARSLEMNDLTEDR